MLWLPGIGPSIFPSGRVKIFSMGEKTLFQIFSVPRETFAKSILRENYHRLIRAVHPDKKSDHTEGTERRDKAAQFINSAYKTLSNNYTRSVYEYSLDNKKNLLKKEIPPGIVQEEGATVLELEKVQVGCNKGLVSVEFLDGILGLEDQIDQSYGEKLEEIAQDIRKKIETCKINKKEAGFLAQWRYYIRLLDIIDQKRMIE